jgi:hypothetical protein
LKFDHAHPFVSRSHTDMFFKTYIHDVFCFVLVNFRLKVFRNMMVYVFLFFFYTIFESCMHRWFQCRVFVHQGSHEYHLAHVVVWLANGFFGVCYNDMGDIDWHAAYNEMPRTNARLCCAFCPANIEVGPLAWNDFRTNVPLGWMQQTYGHRQWLDSHPDLPAFFTLPGHGIWCVVADYMHCKYLGSDQYFLGSVIKLIVLQLLPGSFDMHRVYKCAHILYRIFTG